MNGRIFPDRPGGFSEVQDEFLPEGTAMRGAPAQDHDLIRRLARERMLAREVDARPATARLRGFWPPGHGC
jgi:hypothetical protein